MKKILALDPKVREEECTHEHKYWTGLIPCTGRLKCSMCGTDFEDLGRKEKKQMFKVEVIADSSGEWVGNGLKFDTKEKAEEYAADLMFRWTAVREWRVVEIK